MDMFRTDADINFFAGIIFKLLWLMIFINGDDVTVKFKIKTIAVSFELAFKEIHLR